MCLLVQKYRVGETGIYWISRVGEMGVGEMGIGETGVGETGVGETGTSRFYAPNFFAHNFEEVEGAYWFGSVCAVSQSVCLSVCDA